MLIWTFFSFRTFPLKWIKEKRSWEMALNNSKDLFWVCTATMKFILRTMLGQNPQSMRPEEGRHAWVSQGLVCLLALKISAREPGSLQRWINKHTNTRASPHYVILYTQKTHTHTPVTCETSSHYPGACLCLCPCVSTYVCVEEHECFECLSFYVY